MLSLNFFSTSSFRAENISYGNYLIKNVSETIHSLPQNFSDPNSLFTQCTITQVTNYYQQLDQLSASNCASKSTNKLTVLTLELDISKPEDGTEESPDGLNLISTEMEGCQGSKGGLEVGLFSGIHRTLTRVVKLAGIAC